MGLPKLVSLPRGDFLCDVLGWIDYLEEMEDPIFLIRDFFPSQSYYFHEAWQLELASRMCPFISRMLFIFHETCVPDFLVILQKKFKTKYVYVGIDGPVSTTSY
jgi:hypothetical protein